MLSQLQVLTKDLFFQGFCYLLLRVLKPLFLKKRTTRIVFRMPPKRNMMQMITSKMIKIRRPVLDSADAISASVDKFII